MTFEALNYQSPERELSSQGYFLCPLPCLTVDLPADVHPLKSVPMQKHGGTVYCTPDRRKLQIAWLLFLLQLLDARQELSIFLDFFMCAYVWYAHARVHMPMCTYGESPYWFLLLFPTLFFKITCSSSIGQKSPGSLLSLPPDTGIHACTTVLGFLHGFWVS